MKGVNKEIALILSRTGIFPFKLKFETIKWEVGTFRASFALIRVVLAGPKSAIHGTYNGYATNIATQNSYVPTIVSRNVFVATAKPKIFVQLSEINFHMWQLCAVSKTVCCNHRDSKIVYRNFAMSKKFSASALSDPKRYNV